MQINFKDVGKKSIVHSDQVAFSRTTKDRGWTDFAAISELKDSSYGWTDEQGRLLFRAAICLKQADQICMPLDADTRKELNAVGIRNHGATCYLNGLLQSLFHLGKLRALVYKATAEAPTLKEGSRPGTGSESNSHSLVAALARTFVSLQTAREPVDTKELIRSFGWDSLDAFTQHDAQELQRLLLDRVEDKLKSVSLDGELKSLLEGKIENYIECVDVDYQSKREETLFDIPLSLRNAKNEPIENLVDALNQFCAVELLVGDNAYLAEGHGRVKARKGIRFVKFPPILNFQLKRFHFDLEKLELVKLNDKFEFPAVLDLSPFCPEAGTYRLHSVLVHTGDINSGHYYTFVEVDGGKWLRLDDETVAPSSKYSAINDNYGGVDLFPINYLAGGAQSRPRPRQHSAYMLVYVQESEIADILKQPDVACDIGDLEPNRSDGSWTLPVRMLVDASLTDESDESVHVRVSKSTSMTELSDLVKAVANTDTDAEQKLGMWVARKTNMTAQNAFGIFDIQQTYEFMHTNSDDVSCYLFGDSNESIVVARLPVQPPLGSPTLVTLKRLEGRSTVVTVGVFVSGDPMLEDKLAEVAGDERIFSVSLLGVKEFDRTTISKLPTSAMFLVIGNDTPMFYDRKKHEVQVTVRMRDVTAESLMTIFMDADGSSCPTVIVNADSRWRMNELADAVKEKIGNLADTDLTFLVAMTGIPLIGCLSDHAFSAEMSLFAVAKPQGKLLVRAFDEDMRETSATYVTDELLAGEAERTRSRIVIGQRGVILRHGLDSKEILNRYSPNAVEGIRLEKIDTAELADETEASARSTSLLTDVQQVDKNTGQNFGMAFLLRVKSGGETAKDIRTKIAKKSPVTFPGRWRLLQSRKVLKDDELVSPGVTIVMEYLSAPGSFSVNKPLTIR